MFHSCLDIFVCVFDYDFGAFIGFFNCEGLVIY